MSVPNVSYKVEIAWDSTRRTPAVDRTWTDVSAFVELRDGIKIDYGRSDELAQADANRLTLTFDNSDGRFTWDNAASPYYPNVKLGKPIRVTATTGGVDYVRFTGLIDEWPVEWPGESEGYAKATISASSRIATMGLNSPLGYALDEAIRITAPAQFWPLTEPSGAERGENSIDARIPLMPYNPSVVAFGHGADGEDETFSMADGRGGAKLFTVPPSGVQGGLQSGFFPADVSNFMGAGTPGGMAVSLFVRNVGPDFTPGISAAQPFAFFGGTTGSIASIAFALDRVTLTLTTGVYTIVYPTSLADDTSPTHLMASLSCDGSGYLLELYVNGSLAGSASVLSAPVPLNFDSSPVEIYQPGDSSNFRNVIVGRVGVWYRYVTPEEIFEIAEAGFWGYRFQSVSARLIRNAKWAGLPESEVLHEPGTSSRPLADDAKVSGRQIVDAFRELETYEQGVLHDDRDGNLVLQMRGTRYTEPVGLALSFATRQVGGYAPTVDRQGTVNQCTVTGPTGGSVTVTDQEAWDDYGLAARSIETLVTFADEPADVAAWVVNGYAEPRPRVPVVRINVIDYLADSIPQVMTLDIGSRLSFTDGPAQAPGGTTADYFIEGYVETIGVGSWSLEPNLSPAAPWGEVLLLDDAARGVLDTNIIAL
jgi:hypothetical protein